MVCLGHYRIGFQLRDQAVIGERLPQAVPGVERTTKSRSTMGTLSGVLTIVHS